MGRLLLIAQVAELTGQHFHNAEPGYRLPLGHLIAVRNHPCSGGTFIVLFPPIGFLFKNKPLR